MFKDHKVLLGAGAALTVAAVTTSTLHSDATCPDRAMCAPLPQAMADVPSGDEPAPPFRVNPPTVAASTSVVYLTARSSIRLVGRGGLTTT